MRIAVISDIHGNDLAFAAVVTDIHSSGIDQIICCGDAIQGGAQPSEVVRRLQELKIPVVLGNADDLVLHGDDSDNEEPLNDWTLAVREWTVSKLSAADLAYIATFPQNLELPLPNGKRLIAGHGSPQHFNHVILPHTPDSEVLELLGPIENAIVCGGHTHLQQIRQLDLNFFFNPGSVSLPSRPNSADGKRKVNPWAEYAVLTVEASGLESLEFRRVRYDIEPLLALIDSSGMPNARTASDFYRPA
jgi:putative phosphoesterase